MTFHRQSTNVKWGRQDSGLFPKEQCVNTCPNFLHPGKLDINLSDPN